MVMDFSHLRGALLVLALIAGVAACTGGTRTTASAGQTIDDAAITTKIKAKLVGDERASAFRIEVTTFKGVVQLSGFANTDMEIQRAVELAKSVSGVISVKNDIRLKGK